MGSFSLYVGCVVCALALIGCQTFEGAFGNAGSGESSGGSSAGSTSGGAALVTAISPSAGNTAGGTSVIITGAGFQQGATITINGAPVGGLTVGPTLILGTTSASGAGTFPVVVTNPDGTVLTGGSYSYRPAPIVSSISPSAGATGGGTTVTIGGSNFYSGAQVTIGGTNCSSVTLVSSTTLTCVSGFHPAGVVDVVVTNSPDNQASTGGSGLFTYGDPPQVVSVSPTSGFVAGGGTLTVNGTGFASGSSVLVGTNACTGVSFVSSNSLTCTLPQGTAGTVAVRVTNPDSQNGSLASAYTYRTDSFATVDQYLGSVAPNGFLDGTSSAVRFNNPSGVAVSASGSVFSSEFTNCVVRLISTGGVTTTVAGIAGSCASTNGPGSSARFRNPRGMVLNAAGDTLYIAEWGAIRAMSTSSPYTVSTIAGSASAQGGADGTGTAARFNDPISLVLSADESTLYVADTGNHTIRAVTIATGAVTTIAGAAGSTGSANNATGTSARFNTPSGITRVGSLLYVTDLNNHTVRTVGVSAPYPVSTVAGVAGSAGSTDAAGTSARLNRPYCVFYDGTYLWVCDGNSSTVRQVDLPGLNFTTLYGAYNSQGSSDDVYNSARFNLPYQIAGNGSLLFVADYNNHVIRRITLSSGTVDTLSGVPNSYGYADGNQSDARFYNPRAISLVGTNLYLGEWQNCVVRKVDLTSLITTTFAGLVNSCSALDGTGTFSARFNRLAAMATDGSSIFVADTNSHTVRKLNVGTASVTTLAGSNGNAGNATGTGTTARFNTPYGIAVIGTTIYLADSSNHAIRAISSTASSTNGGVVTTYAGVPGSAGYLDGSLASAQFNNPRGLVAMVVGGQQHLYVSDYSNCVIRDINVTTASVSTLAGTQGSCSFADGTGTLARFNGPWGITTDGTNLYVADYNNHSVRKINGNVVTTVFGDPTSSYDPGSGPVGGSNVRFPISVLWTNYGLFVLNDFGLKRVH